MRFTAHRRAPLTGIGMKRFDITVACIDALWAIDHDAAESNDAGLRAHRECLAHHLDPTPRRKEIIADDDNDLALRTRQRGIDARSQIARIIDDPANRRISFEKLQHPGARGRRHCVIIDAEISRVDAFERRAAETLVALCDDDYADRRTTRRG